jgi:hypothetical protein
MKPIFIYISMMLFMLFSCRKNTADFKGNQVAVVAEKTKLQIVIAKALVKSLSEEPSLRKLIKDEALRKFDKDYDVLFQLIKDKKPDGKETVYEKLIKYCSSKNELDDAINKLPLLTIFVPNLPNFSPEKWNVATEVPAVALVPEGTSRKVLLLNAELKQAEIPFKSVPAFPTVVIKDNERVILNSDLKALTNSRKNLIPGSDREVPLDERYSFLSQEFDGITQSTGRIGTNIPASGSYEIDPVAVAAYKSGNEWHRDYVYYGIDPSNNITSGKFRNNYSEFIRSFRFVKGNDYSLISDDGNDPVARPGIDNNNTWVWNKQPYWTEGSFEFRLSVLINAKNGTGQELRKIFTFTGNDLFTIIPKVVAHLGPFGDLWSVDRLEPKVAPMNVELIPWDLENYGTAWKFIVSEYDPSVEVTSTVTNTTTYGGNFEFSASLGEKIKVGPKFGASATTTNSSSYTYKKTTSSDDLGEGILDFRSPIITSYSAQAGSEVINTYEVSTGVVSFSVEPRKIY